MSSQQTAHVIHAVLRVVNLILAVVAGIAMGMIRLIAIVADGITPFLGTINAIYFQSSGPLLRTSYLLQAHYVVWSSVFSIAALILALRWADQPTGRAASDWGTLAAAMGVLLTALLLAVVYPGILTQYDVFLRTTSSQGVAWFWRNLLWSLVLILTYSVTFSLLSLGMTLLAAIAYRHIRERTKEVVEGTD